MKVFVALIGLSAAAVTVLVILLNALNAEPGIAVAALLSVAAVTGAALGCLADRLPEPSGARRTRSFAPRHVDR
jgi:hypothetical protein